MQISYKSFAKGSIGSFLIGTGIEEEINEVIKRLNEMATVYKCFNLVLNNTHPVYVYTVLKIFNILKFRKAILSKIKALLI